MREEYDLAQTGSRGRMFFFLEPFLDSIKVVIVSLAPLVFICMAGLTLTGSAVALTLSTPLFIIFSPVLVPATLAAVFLTTGFAAGGSFITSAISLFIWMIKNKMKGKQEDDLILAESGDPSTRPRRKRDAPLPQPQAIALASIQQKIFRKIAKRGIRRMLGLKGGGGFGSGLGRIRKFAKIIRKLRGGGGGMGDRIQRVKRVVKIGKKIAGAAGGLKDKMGGGGGGLGPLGALGGLKDKLGGGGGGGGPLGALGGLKDKLGGGGGPLGALGGLKDKLGGGGGDAGGGDAGGGGGGGPLEALKGGLKGGPLGALGGLLGGGGDSSEENTSGSESSE